MNIIPGRGLRSIPGGTEPLRPKVGDTVKISINPKFKYPGKFNPAEIANTILHELIHAALVAAKDCPQKKSNPCPLPKNVDDFSHDPVFRDEADFDEIAIGIPPQTRQFPNFLKSIREALKNDYGREPLFPNDVFSDINNAAKDLIDAAISDITNDAGIGKPTQSRTPE